jgi:hypothetical protein
MTHISNDLYEVSRAAVTKTSQTASLAAAKTTEAAKTAVTSLNRNGKILFGEAKVKWALGLLFANEQFATHWPKVKPHYDKHIVPLVEQFLKWKAKEVDPRWAVVQKQYREVKTKEFDPRYAAAKKEYNKRFSQLAIFYGENCHSAITLGRSLAKVYNFTALEQIAPSIIKSCEQPELSMTYLQRSLYALMILPLRRRLWAFVMGVGSWAWSIFMNVTLLRFVFGKKKSPKPTKKGKASTGSPTKPPGSNNGVRVKKKTVRVSQ